MRRRRNYSKTKYMWNGGVNNSNFPSSIQKKGMIMQRSPNVSQSSKNHFCTKDLDNYYDWLLKNRVFHLPYLLGVEEFSFSLFDVFPYDQTSHLEQIVDCGYNKLHYPLTMLMPKPNKGCHWSFVIMGIKITIPKEPWHADVGFTLAYQNEMLEFSEGADTGRILEPPDDSLIYYAPTQKSNFYFNLAVAGTHTCYMQSFKQSGTSPFSFEFTRLQPNVDDTYEPFDIKTGGIAPLIYNPTEFISNGKSGTLYMYFPASASTLKNDNKDWLITFSVLSFETPDK